jgi:hypothetical protein
MSPRQDELMVFTPEQWTHFLARIKTDQIGPR